MAPNIISKTSRDNNNYILYDESALKTADINLFNPIWLESHAEVISISTGRGSAWFVNFNDQQWVLRHFLRGGFISRFVRNTYWSCSLNSSRSWHEWNLLNKLYTKGLPVPRPVAANIHRRFGFYQADIIIEKIHDTETLAERLNRRRLTNDEWIKLATTIRDFHDYGVYHADLNANNILLNKKNEFYIIDFDRGQIKKSGTWKEANLARLKRSLNKIKYSNPQFYYTNDDWMILQNSYYSRQSL